MIIIPKKYPSLSVKIFLKPTSLPMGKKLVVNVTHFILYNMLQRAR